MSVTAQSLNVTAQKMSVTAQKMSVTGRHAKTLWLEPWYDIPFISSLEVMEEVGSGP